MSDSIVTSQFMPLYVQIVGNIKYAIDSGELKVGDRLPSETELGKRYSVSRITVRRAISELVDAGYLVKRQGRGTFVRNAGDLHLVQRRTDLDVYSFTDRKSVV